MATLLKRVEPQRGKYPWKEWTDGKARQATQGTDFFITVKGFHSILYNVARRLNLDVQAAIQGTSVSFQFSKKKPAKAEPKKTKAS